MAVYARAVDVVAMPVRLVKIVNNKECTVLVSK